MKKLSSFLSLTLLSIFLSTACKEHHHATEHSHEHNQADLRLNNGAKWKADKIARETFAKLKKEAASAKLTDKASTTAFVKAQQKNIDALLKGCTMQGEAHNQLHILIGKTIPAVDALKNTQGEAAKKAQQQLQESVALFDQYFN